MLVMMIVFTLTFHIKTTSVGDEFTHQKLQMKQIYLLLVCGLTQRDLSSII